MFADNLKAARQEKGISQAELASRLNVVRQTVSKWERGLSVPDAEMLVRISDALDTSVAVLLGAQPAERAGDEATTNDLLALQLANLNEQLAVQNRRRHRVWVTVVAVLAVLAIICVMLFLFNTVAPAS